MKSVLMIPYYFPPEGSAGVYRPLRFVRQLSKLGWETTVVTVDPYCYERYDQELINQVPRETEIIRVRGIDPWQAFQAWRGARLKIELSGAPSDVANKIHAVHQGPFRSRIREIIRYIEAYYYFPDLAKPWIRPAVKIIREICTKKHPTVLWATIGPLSTGVVAQQASQYTRIPYVLDFRDPWELYYYEREVQRPKWISRLAQRTLYSLFEGAQASVFLFPRVAESYFNRYKGALDPSKIHIIPNGYEGLINEFHVPNESVCTILYTGTIATYKYESLLQALHDWKEAYPIAAKQLKFIFLGDGMDSLGRKAEELNLADIVETSLPVSYAEAIRFNERAHAFLILGRPSERKGHELVAGAKLFGYFKARKPIIGILPRDETREILTSVGVETIADANSVSEIVNVIKRVHAAWNEGQLSSLLPDAHACERYSSEPQTLALLRALEGFPPVETFVPGRLEIPYSLRELFEDQKLWYRKQ